jgi:hypothetical protein
VLSSQVSCGTPALVSWPWGRHTCVQVETHHNQGRGGGYCLPCPLLCAGGHKDHICSVDHSTPVSSPVLAIGGTHEWVSALVSAAGTVKDQGC